MFKIGICGLGTVGKYLINHIVEYQENISKNCAQDILISMIADRSISKKKVGIENIELSEDVLSVVDSDCDLIIELIGGTDIAYDLVKKSINAGKSVITANKALIAEHGDELFKLSNEKKVYLGFEASVAGAIPIIKTLTQNMSNEKILSISGIINGTCNYILDQMTAENKSFADALARAQELGYAESDPTFDVGGFDAAHKISILSMLAYGIPSPYQQVHIEGIESIDSMDIDYASELGYKIKHVGLAKNNNTSIECRVHPVLIHKSNILSNVDSVMNAIRTKGDKFGTSMLYGHGAGGEATASAVVSNILDFSNFKNVSKIKTTNNFTETKKICDINDTSSSYYLRIFVNDIPGVMAEVTSTLASHDISIEAVTQHEPTKKDKLIPIVMITNYINHKKILSAINQIERLRNTNGKVNIIRVFNDDE